MNKSMVDRQRRKDLIRYFEILPTCEDHENRIFFINGIISLIDLLMEFDWDGEYERCTQLWQQEQIPKTTVQKLCCIPRGELETPEYKKQLVVGVLSYELDTIGQI